MADDEEDTRGRAADARTDAAAGVVELSGTGAGQPHPDKVAAIATFLGQSFPGASISVECFDEGYDFDEDAHFYLIYDVFRPWFGSRFFLAGRGTRHRLVVSDDFVTESEIGAIPRLLRLWRTADVLRGRPNNTTHLSKSGLTWSLK